MSDTRRKFPKSFGNPEDFEDGFEERCERGLVALPILDHAHNERWGRARAFVKRLSTRARRRESKNIQEDES